MKPILTNKTNQTGFYLKPTQQIKPIKQIKQILVLCLFTILAFFLIPDPTIAATYYVDATNGNDLNNGLSPFTVWKTIAKTNSPKFQSDDYILFKRSEIWRETLELNSS